MIVSNNNLNRVSLFATPLNIQFVHSARKPSNVPFLRAMKMMELSPEKTIVVGDQMLTDVYGGNRLGLYTVLVLPISIGDEGFMTRFNRRVERIALTSFARKAYGLRRKRRNDRTA